jgi:hypothetical protein
VCMHFAWGVRVLFLMLLYRCIPLEMRLERMRPPYVDAVASPRAADILFIYGVTHHKKTKSTRYKVLAKDYAATMQQACTRAQFAHHHGCPQLHTSSHVQTEVSLVASFTGLSQPPRRKPFIRSLFAAAAEL